MILISLRLLDFKAVSPFGKWEVSVCTKLVQWLALCLNLNLLN